MPLRLCGDSSEVDSSIDDESPRTCGGCDAAERAARRVDIHRRVTEVRMVQDVDCIKPEFKFLVLVNLEPLDHIHIETQKSRTFHRAETEIPDIAGAWIYHHDVAFRVLNRFVAE